MKKIKKKILKKKLNNKNEKVLASTFSIILSDENSNNDENLQNDIATLTGDLPDNISDIEINELIQLTGTNSYKNLKNKISNGINVLEKASNFIENNIVYKFVMDMFFGNGIGMMNLSEYANTALSDIKEGIKKITNSTQEENEKLINNIDKVSNTITFKLLENIIGQIEKLGERNSQTFLKKLALKNIIFGNIDLNNLNTTKLEENKQYLITKNGILTSTDSKGNKEEIKVVKDDIVILKKKEPFTWEKLKNPTKTDLFSTIIVVLYNILVKEKNDYKYVISKIDKEKFKLFLNEINIIFTNSSLNNIVKRSECSKIYLKYLNNNSSFDPILSFISYMAFVINYKNNFVKYNSKAISPKNNNKINGINLDEKEKNYLNTLISNSNYFINELKSKSFIEITNASTTTFQINENTILKYCIGQNIKTKLKDIFNNYYYFIYQERIKFNSEEEEQILKLLLENIKSNTFSSIPKNSANYKDIILYNFILLFLLNLVNKSEEKIFSKQGNFIMRWNTSDKKNINEELNDK